MNFRYSVFGIDVASELELPECESIPMREASQKTADVEIRYSAVPERLVDACETGRFLDIGKAACILRVPNVGRFLACDGQRIFVELDNEADELAVRAYVLGTALGAIIHQRKMLPLHMSAIATPSGVVAFAGPSGSGKSTIVAAIHLRTGWPLLTDDLAVLQPFQRGLQIITGVRRLRLWLDAIKALSLGSLPASRVVARADKFQFEIPSQLQENKELFLSSVVVLDKGEKPELVELSGAEAFNALTIAIYRPDIAQYCNDTSKLFHSLSFIANNINVMKFRRPFTSNSITESAEMVIDRFSS